MDTVKLLDGKYTINYDNGVMEFLRHGEAWPAADELRFTGVVAALVQRVIELEQAQAKCADPIVEQNVELLRERSTVGVQKYGTTLADNKLTHKQWLRHALEELLDGANYLQAALQENEVPLDENEKQRMHMAAISTAAKGYCTVKDVEGTEFDTPTLRDVVALYAKYESLFNAANPVNVAPVTERCGLCQCDHGHAIGCANNPVDIALHKGTVTYQPIDGPFKNWGD